MSELHHWGSPRRAMITRICFVRHGETAWNLERRIQGHRDIPLNRTGRAQALAVAYTAARHRFGAIYSSDLTRAMDTARAIAERERLEVQPLPELRERHFGIFQGITAAEGAERHPHAYARYNARDPDYDFETGESLQGFAARVLAAVDWLVRHHPGQTLCAVSHGGVLDVLYRRVTGMSLQTPRDFTIPNCALNWFRFDEHGWHLERWADRHHLEHVIVDSPE